MIRLCGRCIVFTVKKKKKFKLVRLKVWGGARPNTCHEIKKKKKSIVVTCTSLRHFKTNKKYNEDPATNRLI